MITGFGNNVVSSLAADITASQTTIQVMPGAGALFSGLLTCDYANPSNPLQIYAKITLTDAKETVFEVCHLMAVNNDILTVVRGQEGTTTKGWALNDVIGNFATRGSENQFVQIEQLQSGHYLSGTAGGTANALTLELPATYFVNSATDWSLKTPVVIYPAQTNTAACTLQLVMGGRVLGTFPLYKGNGSQLDAGDLVAGVPVCCLLDATQTFFNVINPVAAYFGKVRTVNSIKPDLNGNVQISASDVDAVPVSGGNMTGELSTTSADSYRIKNENRAFFLRFDGIDFYILKTVTGDPDGLWDDARPLRINAADGRVYLGANTRIEGSVYAQDAFMQTDGNIYGSCWGGYLNNWVNQNYSPRNTWSPSSTGWWRCGSTGLIVQWGTVGAGNDQQVSFPVRFPGFCASVQISQSNSAYGTDSKSNVSATNRDYGGFTAHVYAEEVSADWIAIGW